MVNKSGKSDTRAYFEHVMDQWRPRQQVAHPYAGNRAWLRKYVALKRWITDIGLEHGRVLEIGCGTGLLQDLVTDYVGIDLAATSADYMHKPFCACSATRLPFPDNSFDGIWSIWVLEHIDRPEAVLSEIRRVLKPGGAVFLCAGFAVDSWISQGLHKRPFADLMPRERLVKLTIPLRASAPYKIAAHLPRRLTEMAHYLLHGRPTDLIYKRLEPNYETYWDYDADACAALDSYNLALYFLSRGDEPCYPAGPIRSLLQRSQPQAYIVRK
jgi:ubiquinone/menaquinone biosynthesis C-methylase UbiE